MAEVVGDEGELGERTLSDVAAPAVALPRLELIERPKARTSTADKEGKGGDDDEEEAERDSDPVTWFVGALSPQARAMREAQSQYVAATRAVIAIAEAQLQIRALQVRYHELGHLIATAGSVTL